MSFMHHHAAHADLWVLDELEGEVKYKARIEGKIIKSFAVQRVLNDGSLAPIPKDESDE